MAPEPRFVPRFVAEPSQQATPYGRWAERLSEALRDALDEPFGEIAWFPDRSWHGRTYVPATARTDDGREVFGYVSYLSGSEDGEPEGLRASVDVTDDTAENNPDWTIDISDEVIGGWRGERGETAAMTLLWGVPLVPGAAIATAELANLSVDQCPITTDGRFTLIAPDDYRGDFLDVKLFDAHATQVARQSLYEEE
jgi:hypothetical protein